MKFKSTDEIETIALRDAVIKEIEWIKGEPSWLTFYAEGAVVKDDNSQNTFYTDKYADQMEIRFQNPVIEAVLLEGHKYYDADDKLIEEVPDKPVPEDAYEKTLKLFKDNYIFYGGKPEPDKNCYQMIVDVDEDSYIISFYYDKVIAGWNHFLNKADAS